MMKMTCNPIVLISFFIPIVFGCSPKPQTNGDQKSPDASATAAQVENDTKTAVAADVQKTPDAQDGKPSKAQEKSAEFRPFKFTVDLDEFYQQQMCDEETDVCKSYKELGRAPEIAIHITELAGAAANYDLDCDGDGVFERTGLSQSTSCKYEVKTGKFQIAIRGELPGIMLCGDSESEPIYGFSNHKAVISVDQWGDMRWKTMHEFAANCLNISLPPAEAPNLSEVTDMSGMFQWASNFNQPVEHWDVSHVTNLSNIFLGDLEFNQPVNAWKTANVTNLSNAFSFCRSFNQPLDKWDVSHVTNMFGMFTEASAFNQPLDKWDVSHVINMDGMFRGASSFNQPLESWKVSNVTNMEGMFNRAAAFNQPLENWDVSNVKRMNAMFWGATSFRQNLSKWAVSASCDTREMFRDSGYKDLPNWLHE